MPTYNYEKYIKLAIKSILSQETRYNWELLINDDCSTGKYIAILESDDIWINEFKLEKQIYFLEKNEYYGLISSDFIRIDENYIEFDSVSHDFDKIYALFSNNLVHST